MAHEEEEAAPEAPEWIVTFSDMITLLVTFFVLLLTFQSSGGAAQSARKLGLAGSRGVLPGQGFDPIGSEDAGLGQGDDEEHTRPDIELPEDLAKMGQKLDALHIPHDLNEIFDGLRLRFGTECSFAPGSATPSRELIRSLDELGNVLKHYPLLITVEGHTDGYFQPDDQHPDAESLSLARAMVAARILQSSAGFPDGALFVVPRGAMYPRVDNDSPLGRLTNRRVELSLLKNPSVPGGPKHERAR
jgi:chemotaxis protein MotB